MSSSLLNLMRIQHPIISAPMSGAATGALAGAVSKAGGLGFIGWNASQPPSALTSEIQIARQSLLPSSTSADSAARTKPSSSIGVGFLCWSLSSLPSFTSSSSAPSPSAATASSTDRPDPNVNPPTSSKSTANGTVPDPLDRALAEDVVSSIWLFAGDYLHWAREIRRREAAIKSDKKPVKIFIQITSLSDAKTCFDHHPDLVDAIVVQSSEAGGHGSPSSLPLSNILPTVLRARAALPSPKSEIPIIAAGGLMIGEHLASALALGADAAVFGTRFLLSEESVYAKDKKEAIRDAELGGTERSDAWDKASGNGWPEEFDARGLSNKTSASRAPLDLTDSSTLSSFKAEYKTAVEANDLSRVAVWAGTGAGLVRDIKPAGEIVKELMEDCKKALARAGRKTEAS